MNVRLLLISSVVFAACGQVLFKKGMSAFSLSDITLDFSGLLSAAFRIVFSPVVFLGLVLYGASTLIWLFALSKTNLSYAYPFTALTFILVMAASYFVFSEAIPASRLLGIGLICLGVIVCSLK